MAFHEVTCLDDDKSWPASRHHLLTNYEARGWFFNLFIPLAPHRVGQSGTVVRDCNGCTHIDVHENIQNQESFFVSWHRKAMKIAIATVFGASRSTRYLTQAGRGEEIPR